MDRMVKINELILHELSRVVSQEIDFSPGSLTTITGVEVTPDLKEARVFVSVLPESERGRVVKLLQKKSFHLHQALNKRVKLRLVPKLLFFSDDTEARAQKIDQLLDSIKE